MLNLLLNINFGVMQLKKWITIFLCVITMTLFTGCGKDRAKSDNGSVSEKELIDAAIKVSSKNVTNNDYDDVDNGVIKKRYENVKKEELTYGIYNYSYYFYESEDELVCSLRLGEVPNIDDKKYWSILKDYTFACLVNSIETTYDEALSMAYKVLPDDIKEEREKFNNQDTDVIRNVIYSSSKGNFILQLVHPKKQDESGNTVIDYNRVVGISYMKEDNNVE